MTIIEDTRQKDGKHSHRHAWWESHGVEFAKRCSALPFGDYIVDGSNVSVDTKRDLAELSYDVLQDHDRFRRECVRASESGWRLHVLTETDMCDSIETLSKLRNVHPSARRAKPLRGIGVAKTCLGMEREYGVVFEFCRKEDSARVICDLLGVDYDRDS